jgi:hypothetical protein
MKATCHLLILVATLTNGGGVGGKPHPPVLDHRHVVNLASLPA